MDEWQKGPQEGSASLDKVLFHGEGVQMFTINQKCKVFGATTIDFPHEWVHSILIGPTNMSCWS